MELVQKHKLALISLLPTGDFWEIHPGSEIDVILSSCAKEFAEIEKRALDLLDSIDPRHATPEVISNWKRVLSIETVSLDLDRTEVINRLTSEGGQTVEKFLRITNKYGLDNSGVSFERAIPAKEPSSTEKKSSGLTEHDEQLVLRHVLFVRLKSTPKDYRAFEDEFRSKIQLPTLCIFHYESNPEYNTKHPFDESAFKLEKL